MYTIYKIINLENNRTYVGMTKHTTTYRFAKHVQRLRKNTHFNSFMQADWNLGHDFIIVKLANRKHKESAKALETKLMNLEPIPYNIAMGNKGDMAGYIGAKFTDNNRSYMYAEISALIGVSAQHLSTRFKVGESMISMIRNGHRITLMPGTSFADVFFCDKTETKVEAPAHSGFLQLYKEVLNGEA
jgi:hypothetical protein